MSRVSLFSKGGVGFSAVKKRVCAFLYFQKEVSPFLSRFLFRDAGFPSERIKTLNFCTKLYQYFFLRVGVGVVVCSFFKTNSSYISTTTLLLSESSFKKRPITCVFISFLRSFLPKKRQKKRAPQEPPFLQQSPKN